MKTSDNLFTLKLTNTNRKCPVGELEGSKNLKERKIPVISCEGACIRGEIARLSANILAKEKPFKRACHGELFTVPDSSMSGWVREAEKVVLIDGCFLRCHGRILENLIGRENIIQFDALSYYKKYTDQFDIDSVSQDERERTAQLVAEKILNSLKSELDIIEDKYFSN